MADLWQIPNRFIISAPFGNYIGGRGMTSTLGTYTSEYRGGLAYRLWRCLRTLRPRWGMEAWTNKLGLPNPGVEWLTCKYWMNEEHIDGSIISISARNAGGWEHCIGDLTRSFFKTYAVELNVSCPNTGEPDHSIYSLVFQHAVERLQSRGWPVIVKLPPVGFEPYVEQAATAGVWGLHCCNTLPTPAGGLSGKPLQLLSLAAVRYIVNSGHPFKIIGGGGITTRDDVQRFRMAGADYFATGSGWFNPLNWTRYCTIARELSG